MEDNQGDIYIIRRVLSRYATPNVLNNVADGETAIAYLKASRCNQSERPDLVLLDINLPLLNGDEVLEWIRSDDSFKDLPVIVLSSSFSTSDIEKMQRFGANDYVTKPDDMEGFARLLQAIESNCKL